MDGVTVGRLCDAVEQSELGAVREMLRRRPEICNLERPGHGEHRALHVAVLRRDAAMVRLLMENGADARRGSFRTAMPPARCGSRWSAAMTRLPR